MALRCEAHGVGVVKLPGDHRLEAPQDEQARKLRQAQAELAALKNRLPALSLHMVAKGEYQAGETCPELPPSEEMALLDVQQMLDVQRVLHHKIGQSAHPLMALGIDKMLYKPEQIDRYNQALDDYFGKYEEYLRLDNEPVVRGGGVIYDSTLYLTNQGSTQANDIEVEMLFPPNVYRLLDSPQADNAIG